MTENDSLFMTLILQYQTMAMVGMGKLHDPVTNKTRRNLAEAKIYIDILEMLDRKTKGNRSADEDKILQQILTDLRLNYVQESSKPEPEPEADEDAENDRSGEPEPAAGESGEPPDDASADTEN